MSQVEAAVRAVIGGGLPEGATSFHTYVGEGGTHFACFLIGKTGAFVDVPLTGEQVADLLRRGLVGTRGWALA